MKPMTVDAGNILRTPDFVTNVVLAAGTGQAFDIPAGARYACFAFDSDFWCKFGSTGAAIATSSSTVGSSALSSELNPTVRDIGSSGATTGLSLVSAAAAKGSISWYGP